jgi:hypothetical protein
MPLFDGFSNQFPFLSRSDNAAVEMHEVTGYPTVILGSATASDNNAVAGPVVAEPADLVGSR